MSRLRVDGLVVGRIKEECSSVWESSGLQNRRPGVRVPPLLPAIFEGGIVETKYEPQGPEGKQCKDCGHFEPDVAGASGGKCFGRDVLAQGTCNMFTPK